MDVVGTLQEEPRQVPSCGEHAAEHPRDEAGILGQPMGTIMAFGYNTGRYAISYANIMLALKGL